MGQEEVSDQDSILKEGMSSIKDLAFSDIFILQYLARFKGPVVRITLLETLNAFLKGHEMSPSSFYSRLKKLKKLQYIQEENARSRNQSISITPTGYKALGRISQINMLGSINFHAHTLKIIPQVLEDLPEVGTPSDTMLLLNLEEGLDLDTLNTLNRFGSLNYIAADDQLFQQYRNMGLPKEILQSRMGEDQILMPENFFDRVLIVGLECHEFSPEVENWINEAHRLLKPGGLFVISSIAQLPHPNHFLLQGLVEDLIQNTFVKFANSDVVQLHFDRSTFDSVTIKTYNGQLVAWSHKA